MFFIDANNFKLINDSLGHQFGDMVLQEIGRRLQKNFREVDTVARFGGDEFAVLMDDVHGVEEVLLLAQRLLESTSEPYSINGQEFMLSVSAGITLGSMGYEFAEDAMRDADIAMYKSKEAGEASFRIYDHVMHAQLMDIFEIADGPAQCIQAAGISAAISTDHRAGLRRDPRLRGALALELAFVGPAKA